MVTDYVNTDLTDPSYVTALKAQVESDIYADFKGNISHKLIMST